MFLRSVHVRVLGLSALLAARGGADTMYPEVSAPALAVAALS